MTRIPPPPAPRSTTNLSSSLPGDPVPASRATAAAIGVLRGVALSPRVAEALDFARRAHGEQRYGNEPYQVHLEEVMRGCQRLGFVDDTSLMAAALHDVIEDTSVGEAGLAAKFGARLARLVRELSHDRGTDTVDYLAAMSDEAFAVKLADRLANVERMGLLENSPDRAAYLLAKYGPEMALFAAEAEKRGMTAPFGILAAAMTKTTAAIEGAVTAYELAEARARVAAKNQARADGVDVQATSSLTGGDPAGTVGGDAHVAKMAGKQAISSQSPLFARHGASGSTGVAEKARP